MQTYSGEPHTNKYIHVDDRNRITLGRLAQNVDGYYAKPQEGGKILLEPIKNIPAEEAWIFEDKEVLASVMKSLQQSKEGKVSTIEENFTKFISEE